MWHYVLLARVSRVSIYQLTTTKCAPAVLKRVYSCPEEVILDRTLVQRTRTFSTLTDFFTPLFYVPHG